jgi:hypothetical protein
MPVSAGSCLDVHQRDQPSMAACAQGNSSGRGERIASPGRAGKKMSSPTVMHNIAASQNFNAPLDGTSLLFCKLLPISLHLFSGSLIGLPAGLMPGSAGKGRRRGHQNHSIIT